jgi:Tat protein translocase TatB subunit
MFDIGIQELLMVFLVALLVFGPKRLPELGRSLGKFMFEIRKGINEMRSQVESEFKEMEGRSAVQVSEQAGREEALSSSDISPRADSGEKQGNV